MSNSKKKKNNRTNSKPKSAPVKANEKTLTSKIITIAVAILLLGVIAFSLVMCTRNPLDAYKEDTATNKDTYYVAMNVKNHGVVILKLDAKSAPITVANFVKLVREDFYDGLTFHRVIKNFMIQGGDPSANGTGGSKDTIKGEFSENGYYNPIKHEKGVISMARSSNPNSASSQFFICNDTSYNVSASLDGKYAAFGHVIDGIEIIDEITADTAKYGDYNGTINNKKYQAVITEMKVIVYEEK